MENYTKYIDLEMLEKADGETKCKIAEDPLTSLEALEMLAKDRIGNVRWAVAKNPSTPAKILEILAKDTNLLIRCDVACHPSVTLEILEELSKDKEEGVREEAFRGLERMKTRLKEQKQAKEREKQDLLLRETLIGEIKSLMEENQQLDNEISELKKERAKNKQGEK